MAAIRRWKKWTHTKQAAAPRWQARPASSEVHFDPSLKTAAQLMTGDAEPHRAA